MSLKVIETRTIRKVWFRIHIPQYNYGPILYYFWDTVRYLSNIASFSYPAFDTPVTNTAIMSGMEKLGQSGYPMVRKLW